MKTLQKMDMEGTYLNIIKAIYDKPIANVILSDKPKANVILNCEKLKAFLLRSETRKGCPFLSLLFNIVLEVLATSNKKKKYKFGTK